MSKSSKQNFGSSDSSKIIKELNTLHMTRISFSASDKVTKKIIAPFEIVKKIQKRTSDQTEIGGPSFYFNKKPSFLLHDMYKYLNDSYELTNLLHETTYILRTVTNATGSVLYVVDSSMGEIVQSCRIQSGVRHRAAWKIRTAQTIAAYVALHKEYVMVDDVWEDSRFPSGVGWKGPNIKSVLCVPIVNAENECSAVIELYRDSSCPPFTKDNLKITVVLVSWMGIAIDQNSIRIAFQKERDLNKHLLSITENFYNENVPVNKMVTDMVKLSKQCVDAERGRFFIVDDEIEGLQADVYDEGIEPVGKSHEILMYKRKLKVNLLSTNTVISLVARTGNTLNIKDRYNDPNYRDEIDPKTLLINRSTLCLPILGTNKKVLGIIEMNNKLSGPCFTSVDEVLLNKFASYCSLTLNLANARKRIRQTESENKLCSEIIDYLIQICLSEKVMCKELKEEDIPTNFKSFSWYYTPETETMKLPLCLYMIEEVAGQNNVDGESVLKIISFFIKCYKQNPFHNFEHAFNVMHAMFNFLIRNEKNFSLAESEALILAALVHDVGHVGFTNSFLCLTEHPLAQLDNESPLENFHYEIAKTIIGEANFFINLTETEVKEFHSSLKEAILATDLSVHLRKRSELNSIIEKHTFDWENQQHRRLVMSVMMTICDANIAFKPYSRQRAAIENLYKEFHAQGDIEKSMNLKPLRLMDRENPEKIVEYQLQYLVLIVLPAAKLLHAVLRNTENMMELIEASIREWQEEYSLQHEKVWMSNESYEKET